MIPKLIILENIIFEVGMKRCFILIFICFCLLSCSNECVSINDDFSKKRVVSLIEWNLQTFFDGETLGTEYAEFVKSDSWNRSKYESRLKKLCDFIAKENADVFVFEEIENIGIIHDISNSLAGFSWSDSEKWMYSCFAKNEGTSIGCGIISKFPIMSVKTHEMDIRVQRVSQPSSRPLIQASLDVDGKSLDVFVAHWKSKSGGELETEIWRDWQESLCGYRLKNFSCENRAAIVCGDFNRNAEDFFCRIGSCNNEKNTFFRFVDFGCSGQIGLFSPWLVRNEVELFKTGSYFYQNEWERIDNIFGLGEFRILDFCPLDDGEWVNEDGTPFRYKMYNEKGYSDHLPISCKIEL